ncbi:HAD-like domain-containing protein [Annulohypoxylon moriforme]|nr:HAD-like domain-containing protein [Annulohypoxylon moriforme]
MTPNNPSNVLKLGARLTSGFTTPSSNYVNSKLQIHLLTPRQFTTGIKRERNYLGKWEGYYNYKSRSKQRRPLDLKSGIMSNQNQGNSPPTWEKLQQIVQAQVTYDPKPIPPPLVPFHPPEFSPLLSPKPSPLGIPKTPNLKQTPVHAKDEKRDEIVPPSPESGGVPEPSPEYLNLASHPPFILPDPRIIFILIDLNGTLLFRPSRNNPTKFVMRPYAKEFLSYCIRTFRVAIWSSARMKNIGPMLDQLLYPEQRDQLVGVWGREHFGLSYTDFKRRVMCYKRLTRIWSDPQAQSTHPDASLGKRWDQTNTLLIDDSVEKARSEPYNIVQIPEFHGDPREEGYILPQIHDYINECSRQVNISSYIKQSPFVMQYGFQLASQQTQ